MRCAATLLAGVQECTRVPNKVANECRGILYGLNYLTAKAPLQLYVHPSIQT